MSIQPFKSRDRIIVEARHPDGSLRFDCKQPPTELLNTTLDRLYQLMWVDPQFKDAEGTSENLYKWLSANSWTIRARYW